MRVAQLSKQILGAGVLALSLSVLPIGQGVMAQTGGTAPGDTTTAPGTTGTTGTGVDGTTTTTTSPTYTTTNRDNDFDWGWLGLLGLLGLAGLSGRHKEADNARYREPDVVGRSGYRE